MRAGDTQLRPVHLGLHALPRPADRPPVTGPAASGGNAVVIGIGNEFRRDDGAGPAVLARLHGRVPGGVELLVSDGEPAGLIEAWAGKPLAVIVDAVRAEPSVPGCLHRLVLHRVGAEVRPVSSHGL